MYLTSYKKIFIFDIFSALNIIYTNFYKKITLLIGSINEILFDLNA